MIRISIAALFIFFAAEGWADIIETSGEEEQPTIMPARLEESQQESKKKAKEESSIGEAFSRSGLDIDKPDPDTSKLSPSERTDIGQSPGADMRQLDPKYMEVKVLYVPPETSWWERALESIRNFFTPSV